MITLKIDKETFNAIKENNSVKLTDGKRDIIFRPDMVQVFNFNENSKNGIQISNANEVTINMKG